MNESGTSLGWEGDDKSFSGRYHHRERYGYCIQNFKECLKAGHVREGGGSKNLKGPEGHAELGFYLQGLISLGDLHRELGMRDCFFGASGGGGWGI